MGGVPRFQSAEAGQRGPLRGLGCVETSSPGLPVCGSWFLCLESSQPVQGPASLGRWCLAAVWQLFGCCLAALRQCRCCVVECGVVLGAWCLVLGVCLVLVLVLVLCGAALRSVVWCGLGEWCSPHFLPSPTPFSSSFSSPPSASPPNIYWSSFSFIYFLFTPYRLSAYPLQTPGLQSVHSFTAFQPRSFSFDSFFILLLVFFCPPFSRLLSFTTKDLSRILHKHIYRYRYRYIHIYQDIHNRDPP